MKNLVIVESPSKSKTIEKYLGKDYKVVSSKGHIRDLATKGKEGLGVDIANDFTPIYEVSKDKKDVVKALKADCKKADFVYLATDPDREGEAISWHLAEVLGLDENLENRIVFNEITKSAVTKALQEPRQIDFSLVKSQETRRILDRIIGFKLSKLLRSKIRSKSAGRVQSIALRMICDREKEIAAFVPQEYWTIKAALAHNSKIEVTLSKVADKKAEIKNEEAADELITHIGKTMILSDIAEKEKKRAAYLPFITSTLQQEASSKLSFSSKKTMMVAQTLYEGVDIAGDYQGLITYMRTDSTRLSKEFVEAALSKIEADYGKEYRGHYRVKNDDNSQDAHEAIRPTRLENTPDAVKPYLSNDQYKLYKLIYARALASLMADCKSMTTTYTFITNDLTFTAAGSRQLFDGFLKVYKDYDSSKDVILPALKVNDELEVGTIDKSQHFTEGPSRYTEAKLIKALEEEGVGRPSTYATIIETIQKRDYVELKKDSDKSKTKYFYPTEQGILTDNKLKDYFADIINIKYTAMMEEGLDEIALGKMDNIAYLNNFYAEFAPLVDQAYEQMEKIKPEPVGRDCPDCGKPLVYRISRTGDRFISCSGYPECKHAESLEEDKVGELCPECGGELIYRKSRYGRFISCSNYPNCKYIKSLKAPKEEPVKLDRQCPQCGGELLKRKSRYGTYFIGCSNYPKCRYIEKVEKDGKD